MQRFASFLLAFGLLVPGMLHAQSYAPAVDYLSLMGMRYYAHADGATVKALAAQVENGAVVPSPQSTQPTELRPDFLTPRRVNTAPGSASRYLFLSLPTNLSHNGAQIRQRPAVERLSP
jgi:hypothetical protein